MEQPSAQDVAVDPMSVGGVAEQHGHVGCAEQSQRVFGRRRGRPARVQAWIGGEARRAELQQGPGVSGVGPNGRGLRRVGHRSPREPTRRTPWLRRRAVNGSMSSTYHAIEWSRLPKRVLNRPNGVAGPACLWAHRVQGPVLLVEDPSTMRVVLTPGTDGIGGRCGDCSSHGECGMVHFLECDAGEISRDLLAGDPWGLKAVTGGGRDVTDTSLGDSEPEVPGAGSRADVRGLADRAHRSWSIQTAGRLHVSPLPIRATGRCGRRRPDGWHRHGPAAMAGLHFATSRRANTTAARRR